MFNVLTLQHFKEVLLQIVPTDLRRRCTRFCTAGVIEYLQTTMEAVARDSIGKVIQLNSHLGSELLGRFPRPISALEVERFDFVQRQRG